MRKQKGFTLIEVMVGIAMMGIVISIAMPSMNDWLADMRVDDEISQVHRLLLISRNTAVNMDQPVTMCPLDGGSRCTNNWANDISVFIDLNNNQQYEPPNESLIRVKNAIKDGDTLTFPRASIVYQPTGQTGGATGTFVYCPSGYTDKGRAIRVSLRGRAYPSSDQDSDGRDEIRDGTDVAC